MGGSVSCVHPRMVRSCAGIFMEFQREGISRMGMIHKPKSRACVRICRGRHMMVLRG